MYAAFTASFPLLLCLFMELIVYRRTDGIVRCDELNPGKPS